MRRSIKPPSLVAGLVTLLFGAAVGAVLWEINATDEVGELDVTGELLTTTAEPQRILDRVHGHLRVEWEEAETLVAPPNLTGVVTSIEFTKVGTRFR